MPSAKLVQKEGRNENGCQNEEERYSVRFVIPNSGSDDLAEVNRTLKNRIKCFHFE